MHNENCYTNGSYFFDVNINEDNNSIMCVLPGSTLNSGEWVAPFVVMLCLHQLISVCIKMRIKPFYHLMMVVTSVVYIYMFKKNLKVNSEKDGISWDMIQLRVTDWPQDGVVREPRTVLQVIDDVIHRQQKIGGGPVVVHCR